MKTVIVIFLTVLLLTATAGFSADDDFLKGIHFYKKKNYSTSIKHLMAYSERTPDPQAFYLIGYANYKLKNYETAIKYFKDAYILDPNYKPTAIEMK